MPGAINIRRQAVADGVGEVDRGPYRLGAADVLSGERFSFGGRIAMRVVEQHPSVVRRLILASTTAYTDVDQELEASTDYQQRSALSTDVSFDDPLLTGPDAADGALSRAMAFGSAPLQVWRLDQLDAWYRILQGVRFTSDYNRPYAIGALRPAAPDDPVTVLRDWAQPVLILQGGRETCFPVGVARRLHAELPGSTLVEVPEAGHMAHFDNPDYWLAAIQEFLRR